ncbi:MAG: hypothetical protein MJZ23_01795 [Paludibacteraceae bacterium]|nr:hypothetical protein [Paludibacteraceae bacterium]
MLEIGIKGEQSVLVNDSNTAAALGSGLLKVFSTPSALALVEKTCWMSVSSQLEEGQGTVGTRVELDHLATSPIGMNVVCVSELVAVDGRKLVFNASVYNGQVGGELVAKAVHERFIVFNEKFQAKADAKLG